jgi:hypothetical protein
MPKNISGGTNIQFEIRGYDRVRNNLRALIAAHPKEVDPVMERWAEDTRMFLKRQPYPPKPHNSRYRRTGKLASSWKKRRTKPGVWTFYNNATGPNSRFYARYVVGEKEGTKNQRQAWMHRNRWWRADEVIEQVHMPELRIFLDELYVNLWDE